MNRLIPPMPLAPHPEMARLCSALGAESARVTQLLMAMREILATPNGPDYRDKVRKIAWDSIQIPA